MHDLEDNRYAVRRKAQKALEDLGECARPWLLKAVESPPSLELRRRAEWILGRLPNPQQSPVLLRWSRTVEVLEHIATTDALALLERLADGAPGMPLTEEAQAALQRLR